MGVDVDALAVGLVEEHLEVVEVVAGDDDEGALDVAGLDDGRLGVAVGAGVGGVEDLHALEVRLPELEDEAEPLVDGVVVAQRLHALLEPGGDDGVGLAEDAGVVRVGGHSAKAEEQRRAQRDDVLVAMKEIRRLELGGAAVLVDLGLDARDHGRVVRRVEVDVGDAHEQGVHEEGFALDAGGLAFKRAGQGDELGGHFVLEVGDVGLLAADADLRAAFAAGGLFALETEHVVHGVLAPVVVLGVG